MNPHDTQTPDTDPFDVLGVAVDADEETLRQAYLKKLREFPPDRAPEQFERIRDAYDAARNPDNRVQKLLNMKLRGGNLVSILDAMESKRAFTGPGPWLALLKEE